MSYGTSFCFPSYSTWNNNCHIAMTSPSNFRSENFLSETSHSSTASTIDPGMLFQDTSSSLTWPGPHHALPTFTSDPFTSTTLLPNNYYPSSLTPTTQHQQRTAMVGGWTGDSITPDVSVNVPVAANTTGINQGNSSVIYQTASSQLLRNISTRQQSGIVEEFNGDALYRKTPTRSIKHVSIISLYK